MNTAAIVAKLHKNYETCIKKGIKPNTERMIRGIKAPKADVLKVISKEFREIEVGCEPECIEATCCAPSGAIVVQKIEFHRDLCTKLA